MVGMGTDDTGLIRLVVSRAEIDLMNVKAVYFSKFGRTLERAVISETSGDYRKLLLMIVGTNVFNPDEDAKVPFPLSFFPFPSLSFITSSALMDVETEKSHQWILCRH